MNVQEYISSGIIESYVLGLASPEDAAEFEQMCATHIEVRTARDSFERLLEKQLLGAAVIPSSGLKSKIFADIDLESDGKTSHKPVSPKAPVVRLNRSRYLVAASLVLLLGSVLLNFYLATQYKDSVARYDALVATQVQTVSANQVLQTKLGDYQTVLKQLKDPSMAIVKMPGVPTSPDPSSLCTIYWDTHTKDVYLLINQLPRPVTDKQYQLWAIVDGKPVDAGVFDVLDDQSFIKLKNIPQAQAFAITLEKRGGSLSPTMEAMYVMGKVAG